MTNPLAGLEKTVGKEMFHKVRRPVVTRCWILLMDSLVSLEIYRYEFCSNLFVVFFRSFVRFKTRTFFVSVRVESDVNSSKIWLCLDFGEFR